MLCLERISNGLLQVLWFWWFFAWRFVVTVPYYVDTFLWMCLPLPDRVHGSPTFWFSNDWSESIDDSSVFWDCFTIFLCHDVWMEGFIGLFPRIWSLFTRSVASLHISILDVQPFGIIEYQLIKIFLHIRTINRTVLSNDTADSTLATHSI
jgi:hypothetical protein